MNKSIILGFVLVLIIASVFADNYNVGSITIDDAAETIDIPVPDPVVEPLLEGQSVVYYLKAFNGKLFTIDSMQLSKVEQEVLDGVKEIDPKQVNDNQGSVNAADDSLSTKVNKVVWKNVLGSNVAKSIIFPKTTYMGKENLLNIFFYTNRWISSYAQYISVYNNMVEVDCGKDASSVENSIDQWTNQLIFLAAVSKRDCRSIVSGNEYIAGFDVTSAGGGKYNIAISSPLIPDVCNGKEFDNSLASEDLLIVTSKMCN